MLLQRLIPSCQVWVRLPITPTWLYCMTYNSENGITEYGPCPYIADYNTTTSIGYVFYIQLPNNVSLLNEFMHVWATKSKRATVRKV